MLSHQLLKSVGGENTYWVLQLKAADRDRVANVVRAAGGSLQGLGHPGGLPQPLQAVARPEATWERVELWPDSVFYLQGDGRGLRDLQLLAIDPQQGRWQPAVEKLRAETGAPEHRELLAAEKLPLPPSPAPWFLEDPAVLERWLTAWADQLLNRGTAVPLIQPLPRPWPAATRGLLSTAVAVLVAAACAAHHFLLMVPRAARAQAELQTAQKPDKDLKAAELKIKELEKKRDALLKQEARLRQNNEALIRQRKRLPDLLRFLAQHCPDDVTVLKIDNTAGEHHIFALCLHPELADQFAHKLDDALEIHSWHVKMASKQVQFVRENGALWAFELHLEERLPPEPPASLGKTKQPAPRK